MRQILLAIVTIIIFTLSCCTDSDERINSIKLRELVLHAIAGDYDANLSLNGLISTKHVGINDYNQFTINEFTLNNKNYFYVILEYTDPTLNLFAIYDADLNFYLLDKSLNGNLSAEWSTSGSRLFVFLQERFLTKDVVSLDRFSIYEIFPESALLIYRSLSRLVIDKNISEQTVEGITEGYILTKLNGISDKTLDNQQDTFYFNIKSRNYLSKSNYFNKYVKKEIRQFNWVIIKPEIPADMLEDAIIINRPGYQIALGSDWEEIPFFNESKLLLSSLSGTKFLNTSLNSSFLIFEIPAGKGAENYSPQPFGESTTGEYQMRSTEIYESDNNHYQIFEHICGERKFMLLFECSKDTYLSNKRLLDQIISSFRIEC